MSLLVSFINTCAGPAVSDPRHARALFQRPTSDIDTSRPRVRAAVAARAAAVRVAAAVVVMAGVVPAAVLVGAHPAAVAKGDDGCEEEEQAVDDGKSPAGLEHGAGLVGGEVPSGTGDGEVAEAGAPVVAVGLCAVGVGDAAQLVDGADESADEGEVDEGDEAGVGRGAVVGEEGEDGPGDGEDRDDEEDENGVGREGVGRHVRVDEPGEHAHDGDLGSY